MAVILILILASLAVALAFLAAFIWAVKSGQFEDTCTPAMRILGEDGTGKPQSFAEGDQAGVSPHTPQPAWNAEKPERRHVAGLGRSDSVSRQHAGAPVSKVKRSARAFQR